MQPEPRFKKRVSCDLVIAGARHPGIVLNLSRGGLYVQTSLAFQRGDWVAVDLNSSARGDAIGVDAVVRWNRKVAAQLRGVRHGGVGLQIRNAGREYYDLLSLVAGDTGATYRGSGTQAAGAPQDSPPPNFRVRVRLRDRPRSKTVLLACGSAEEARSIAIARAGAGDWEVLDVSALGPVEESD